jgi:hypothetical protein
VNLMGRQTITIAIQETYEPFRQHAERARQSVEDAVVEAMRAALVDDGVAGAEGRQATLAALALLDTPTLWQMVHRGAENEDVLLLAALNEKRQGQGLTDAEERVVRDLIRRHDRAVLLRAKALALLSQRGEDVSALVDGA